MKQFVAVMCHHNMLLQLVTRPVHTEWSVSATCRLVCTDLWEPLVAGNWLFWQATAVKSAGYLKFLNKSNITNTEEFVG